MGIATYKFNFSLECTHMYPPRTVWQPPPGKPLDESLWTFVGVFLTLLLLSAMSGWVKYHTEGEYFLLLGSFGGGLVGGRGRGSGGVVVGHGLAGGIVGWHVG
jgi:hypothetical protein